MLLKTHIAIACAVVLLFLPHVNNRLVFVPVLLIAALIPDIDTGRSSVGNKWYLAPAQLFMKHRGFVHSFTICLIISGFFALYFPILALPFFLGYSSHLLADSFTVEGIRPFWPWKAEANGGMRTGGVFEEGVFYSFVLVNILLLIWIVMSY